MWLTWLQLCEADGETQELFYKIQSLKLNSILIMLILSL